MFNHRGPHQPNPHLSTGNARPLSFLTRQPRSDSRALQTIQDHRLLLRWVYAGRLAIALTVMLAAQLVWQGGEGGAAIRLLATAVFVFAAVFTVLSGFYSESVRRAPAGWFLLLQSVADLLLVTVIVDMRGAASSPFAALYVVVIAVAFLQLPSAAAMAVATLAGVLFGADVLYRLDDPAAELAPASMQLIVMAGVAALSHTISGHLRRAGAGSAALAEQLEHVKLQAADILRTIRSGIITVDSTGRLVQANPAASQLLGIELENLIDKPVLGRLHETSPDLAEMLVRTIKRPTRINRGEAAMPRNGGSIPIGVTTTYAESRDGVPTSATAIFQDISEMKRTELLSLRAERLAAVAELSASLAHEIKNPLASIRSAVEQLARVDYAGDDERTLASLVQRESDRLSRLLTEFLDFSRAQASEFRETDIVRIVSGACELVRAHPDCQQGVRVELIAADDGLALEGDEDLLHRAFFNLALNAAQASPAGEEVRVRVCTREPVGPASNGAGGDMIEVTVANRGPGIPAAMREKLFDPFFTTKAGGSGLGLSVVHRAITSHGGVVLVDSGDEGTTFTVLLPRERLAEGVRT